jgi:DNA-binding transcriptional MerR regulator
MAVYSSGQVEKILGVKNSVLRYWTGEMPLIQPKKDRTGHVIYSGRDIRLLLRLKYLLYTREFSVEAARGQLEKESSGSVQNLRAELDTIRGELVDLFFGA